MATEIKLRRGTTSQHTSFNGAEGEVTFDTDKHTLIVHNNEGNGTGRQVALLSDVQAVDTLAEILALSNTTGGNNIVFGDSGGQTDDRLIFGAGSDGNGDLEIFHNGSHSIINHRHEATGSLFIIASNEMHLQMSNASAGTETAIKMVEDGAVQLFFDNTVGGSNTTYKLATTASGIDVTGEVKGDTLDIDGNASIAGAITDVTTLTASGELEGGSLDINGNADISGNLVLGGDLNVTGTTTTVNQTNLDVSDNIIGLNRGASTNSNDSGFIIERGSTGQNAIFAWDESEDKFTLGFTTATPTSTGNLTIATGTLVANVEGNLTGTASQVQANNSSGGTQFLAMFSADATAPQQIQVEGDLSYDRDNNVLDVNGTVTADTFILEDGSGNKTTLAENASGNITLTLPSATGTVALTSEIPTVPASGISNGNVATFTSGVVDEDFLRVSGTSIEGLSNTQLKSALSLAKGDVGLGNVENKSSATIRGEIVSGNIPTLNQDTTGNAATATSATTANGALQVITSTSGSNDQFVTFVDADSNSSTQTVRVHGEVKYNTSDAKFTVDGTVVSNAITSHQTTVVTSTAQTIATTSYGVRKIHTGGAVTYTFDATGTISGTDIGKSIVIVNAGTGDIDLDITTSKFFELVPSLDADYADSSSGGKTGTDAHKLVKGGVAEFIVTETNKIIIMGSGIQ